MHTFSFQIFSPLPNLFINKCLYLSILLQSASRVMQIILRFANFLKNVKQVSMNTTLSSGSENSIYKNGLKTKIHEVFLFYSKKSVFFASGGQAQWLGGGRVCLSGPTTIFLIFFIVCLPLYRYNLFYNSILIFTVSMFHWKTAANHETDCIVKDII